MISKESVKWRLKGIIEVYLCVVVLRNLNFVFWFIGNYVRILNREVIRLGFCFRKVFFFNAEDRLEVWGG